MPSSRVLPREHGAWAMLVQTSVLALFTRGLPATEHVFLVLATVAAFVARAPLTALYRDFVGTPRALKVWAGALLAVGAISAVIAATAIPFTLLSAAVVLAVALAVFNWRRAERTTIAELTAMLAFSFLVVLGAAMHRGTTDSRDFVLGFVVFAYLAASIPHVRAMVQIRKDPAGIEGARAISFALAANLLGTLITGAACVERVLSPLVFVAMLLSLSRPAIGIVSRQRAKPLQIRTVGLLELATSILFTVLVLIGERS